MVIQWIAGYDGCRSELDPPDRLRVGRACRHGRQFHQQERHPGQETPEDRRQLLGARPRAPSCSPGSGPTPRLARVPKGPYPFKPQLISDDRPPVKQRPLNPAATKLLADYYKRAAFWMACQDSARSSGRARTSSGSRRERAYQIYNEMDPDLEVDSDLGPYNWFRREALLSMQADRILAGRATEGSKLADAFFAVLAGGRRKYDALAHLLEGSHQLNLRLVRSRLLGPDAQALDYQVYSRAC